MFMPSKRIVISLLIILCFSSILFCETMKIEPSKLNGTWMPNFSYLWITSHPDEEKSDYFINDFSWGSGKTLINTSTEIDISMKMFFDPGLGEFSIKNIKQISDSSYSFMIFRYLDENMPETLWERNVIIYFITEDSCLINIDSAEETGSISKTNTTWYRLSGQNVMSQPAYINDSRVRIRVQPNLQSDTWGFLNKGEKVTVIDKSKDKQKIGDMENFWYKVDVSYYPDGWVYGEYITFE